VSAVSLLDSYSQERIAAFHINAENAMRSTEFMSPPSRGFDLLREAALSLSGAHREIANLINPRQTQAVCYDASPLSSEGDELATGPRPGEVMPDQPLALDLHLTDWLRPSFTVLVLNMASTDATLAADIVTAQAGPVPVVVCELPPGSAGESVFEALGAEQGAVYLLRPDGHVAARWRRVPQGALLRALARAAALARKESA